MNAKIYMVDAFTRNSLEGNPCSVVFSSEPIGREMRVRIAKQTMTVVTCFISWRKPDGLMSLDIRYETPVDFLELCGHATLAACKVVYDEMMVPKHQSIELFYTDSQKITAKCCGDEMSINMPQLPLAEIGIADERVETICNGLCIDKSEVIYFGRNMYDYVLQVQSEGTVRNCTPNFPVLKEVDTRAVILTAYGPGAGVQSVTTPAHPTSAGHDTITRVFLPRVGIDEDNVCGSAHCGIARHYSDLLEKKELSCYEPSQRPGSLHITIREEGRLDLRAPCHITFGPAVMHLPL